MRTQRLPPRGADPRFSRQGFRSAPRAETPSQSAPPPAWFPVRLRHVAAAGTVLLLVLWLAPRLRAAWLIQDRAVALADLAVCVAGPSGIDTLLHRPADFRALARRRLVAAEPTTAPFRGCDDPAARLGWSEAQRLQLTEPAARWVDAGWGAGTLTLAELPLDAAPTVELFEDAWPMVRGELTTLVKPSHGALEAPHPLPPPKVGATRGLPAWRVAYRSVVAQGDGFVGSFGAGANTTVLRSRDAQSWEPTARSSAEALGISGRCSQGGQRSFSFHQTGPQHPPLVRSWNLTERVHDAVVGSNSAEIVAAACDGEIAALVLSAGDGAPLQLWHCAFGTQCVQTPVPPSWPEVTATGVDIARVQGTTVIARRTGTIVRVTTSRDRGRSWTPYVVAFDGEDGSDASRGIPERLLTIGSQLLLHAATKGGEQGAIWSQDLGVSWKRL